jgi:hypothetical protein
MLISMSKRLQVILDDAEYRELQRSARRARMTVSAWVRQAIRELRGREPVAGADKKMHVVREATRHAYPAPAPEIGQMLEEIERGYLGGRAP